MLHQYTIEEETLETKKQLAWQYIILLGWNFQMRMRKDGVSFNVEVC
jgi:hypothetical protein